MGNISVCCDAKKQLENIDALTPRPSNRNGKTEIIFPYLTTETEELMLKLQTHPFYTPKNSQT